MRLLLNHARLVFVVVFLVLCVALFAWERVYVWPQKRCEAVKGQVWAPGFQACAKIINLPHIRRLPHASPPA